MATKETRPDHKVELHQSEVKSGESQLEIIDYDIVLGQRGIGEAELTLDRENREVSIDWLFIEEGERGKGYGMQARLNLLSHILKSYKWARTITSSTQDLRALKNAIATPVPEGWQRSFQLKERDAEDNFAAFDQTDDPDVAFDCVVHGGSVKMTIEKPEQG